MVKLPLNSIVGTLNAKFMTIDIKDFYLNTPMARREYMHLKLSNLPESVVQQYNLEVKSTKDGYVHVDIKRDVYGLPQAGLVVQQLLDKRLNKKGYNQSEITTGILDAQLAPNLFPTMRRLFRRKIC